MRKWHRWFGLPAGLFLILAGFTGVWLEVERFFGEEEAQRERIRDLPATITAKDDFVAKLARAQVVLAAKVGDQPLDRVVLQLKGDAPSATFYLAPTKTAEGRKVEVDLATAAVVKEGGYDDGSFILKLHSGEAFGDGGMVLGMGWGAALVVLSISGLVIYWKMRPKNATGLRRIFWLVPLALCLPSREARADSPFYTDDPEFSPGWEIKYGGTAEHNSGGNVYAAPVLDLNYAVVPDVRLDLTLAGRIQEPVGGPAIGGFADTEFKVKWRFVDADTNSWLPSIGIAPKVFFPTSDKDRGLGDGVWRAQLPLQFGKTIGRFYNFAEVGYQMAFRDGTSDVAYYGIGTLYSFNSHFALGTEVFGYTPLLDKHSHQMLATLGAVYTFDANWSLKASLSRTLRDTDRGGPDPGAIFYLVWNY